MMVDESNNKLGLGVRCFMPAKKSAEEVRKDLVAVDIATCIDTLKKANHPYEKLLVLAAQGMAASWRYCSEKIEAEKKLKEHLLAPLLVAHLKDKPSLAKKLLIDFANRNNRSAIGMLEAEKIFKKFQAENAANTRHSQPGGSHDKQDEIRELWATGKYKSRNKCAMDECGKIGMSYATARRALQNTQKPVAQNTKT
jgi:predicted N-acetyltransferase YhbS